MALSTHAYPSTRGLLAGLLRTWQHACAATLGIAHTIGTAERTPRHHYPPRRSRAFEEAAMAREMYRL